MEDSRTYEFACHITTQLEEAQVPAIWEEAQALISQHGGTIIAAQQPERRRLSYEIKHQRHAFFGWVQFQTERGELLAELDEWARLHTEVLRHVTLKLEAESDKRAARQQEHLQRKAAQQAKEGAAAQKKTVSEKKSSDTGALEQQLEDIIEKL